MTSEFIEQAEYEKGFAAYYAKTLAPALDGIEQERQQTARKFITTAAICIAIYALLITGFHYAAYHVMDIRDSEQRPIIFIVLSLITTFIGLGIMTYQLICIHKPYSKDARAALMPHIMRFFSQLQYDADNGLRLDQIANFGILPIFSGGFNSTHYMKGTINGNDWESSLLQLMPIANQRGINQGGMMVQSGFNGLALKIHLKKFVKGEVRLSENTRSHERGLHQSAVTLESPEFNKLFYAVANDPAEAYSLLTPVYIEQLTGLKELIADWKKSAGTPNSVITGYSAFSYCAAGENLLFLLHAPFLFDAGSLFKPVNDTDKLHRILYQMQLIFRLTQVLNPN